MLFTSIIVPNTDVNVSLREAARRAYPRKIDRKKCNCRGKCDTKRCPCYAIGEECTSHCHPSHSCRRRKTQPTNQTLSLLYVGLQNWLTNRHMDEASRLIKKINPSISGLNSTLQSLLAISPKGPMGKFVQFIHVNNNHWVTVSNVHAPSPDTVVIYDSLHGGEISTQLQQSVAKYLKSDGQTLKFELANVEQQKNGYDCGPFSIAYAVSLAYGEDPLTLTFNDIRTDLDSGLKKRYFERFHTDISFRNASLRTYTKRSVLQVSGYR